MPRRPPKAPLPREEKVRLHTINISDANYLVQQRMNATLPCPMDPHFRVTKVVPRYFLMKQCTDHFPEGSEINDAMDEETEHWPVPPRLKEELNKIKFEYYAVPLAVYADDNFIEPTLVNNTIRGALVELHFELHHFAI